MSLDTRTWALARDLEYCVLLMPSTAVSCEEFGLAVSWYSEKVASLKTSQSSQEDTCQSDFPWISVLMCILQNISEQLFCRTSLDDCSQILQVLHFAITKTKILIKVSDYKTSICRIYVYNIVAFIRWQLLMKLFIKI